MKKQQKKLLKQIDESLRMLSEDELVKLDGGRMPYPPPILERMRRAYIRIAGAAAAGVAAGVVVSKK